MEDPVYECCLNGCGKQQSEPGRCRHETRYGEVSMVEMRKRNFPRNSRTDSFAGSKPGVNKYEE